jgi:hypothetical protein
VETERDVEGHGHKDLTARIAKIKKIYHVIDLTYHKKNLIVKERNILRDLYDDMTSLMIRGFVDYFCAHKDEDQKFSFLLELKSHGSSKLHGMAIELIPFLFQTLWAYMGVRCLYVYSDPVKNYEGGFWVHGRPSISACMITERYKRNEEFLKSRIRTILPDVKNIVTGVRVEKVTKEGCSNDPFLIIDESEVQRFRRWEDLINEERENATGENQSHAGEQQLHRKLDEESFGKWSQGVFDYITQDDWMA